MSSLPTITGTAVGIPSEFPVLVKELIDEMPEHKQMLADISEQTPEIHKVNSFFGKRQSQYMDNHLTISHLTPLRNIYQITAEMENRVSAIRDSHFKLREEDIEIARIKRDIHKLNEAMDVDDLEVKSKELELEKRNASRMSSMKYVSGAIRQLHNYTEQYKQLVEHHKLEDFNEEKYEAAEEEYHIKTCFAQGLDAFRARGGTVDEGNQLYQREIGLNPTTVCFEISAYYTGEHAMIQHYMTCYEGFVETQATLPMETEDKPQLPSNEMFMKWLDKMYKKYRGCTERSIKLKGMGKVTETSLIKGGDKRLLELKSE